MEKLNNLYYALIARLKRFVKTYVLGRVSSKLVFLGLYRKKYTGIRSNNVVEIAFYDAENDVLYTIASTWEDSLCFVKHEYILKNSKVRFLGIV